MSEDSQFNYYRYRRTHGPEEPLLLTIGQPEQKEYAETAFRQGLRIPDGIAMQVDERTGVREWLFGEDVRPEEKRNAVLQAILDPQAVIYHIDKSENPVLLYRIKHKKEPKVHFLADHVRYAPEPNETKTEQGAPMKPEIPASFEAHRKEALTAIRFLTGPHNPMTLAKGERGSPAVLRYNQNGRQALKLAERQPSEEQDWPRILNLLQECRELAAAAQQELQAEVSDPEAIETIEVECAYAEGQANEAIREAKTAAAYVEGYYEGLKYMETSPY